MNDLRTDAVSRYLAWAKLHSLVQGAELAVKHGR